MPQDCLEIASSSSKSPSSSSSPPSLRHKSIKPFFVSNLPGGVQKAAAKAHKVPKRPKVRLQRAQIKTTPVQSREEDQSRKLIFSGFFPEHWEVHKCKKKQFQFFIYSPMSRASSARLTSCRLTTDSLTSPYI